MAADAVFLVADVERFLAVMAFRAAEPVLGDAGHVHLVRTLRYVRRLMAGSAPESSLVDMEFVAECYRGRVFRREGDGAAADPFLSL